MNNDKYLIISGVIAIALLLGCAMFYETMMANHKMECIKTTQKILECQAIFK